MRILSPIQKLVYKMERKTNYVGMYSVGEEDNKASFQTMESIIVQMIIDKLFIR